MPSLTEIRVGDEMLSAWRTDRHRHTRAPVITRHMAGDAYAKCNYACCFNIVWRCLTEKHGVTIAQVCSFWTGADCEPPAGFPSPSIRDHFQPDDKPLSVGFYNEKGRLPYASTCGLRLWLPIGVTEAEFNALMSRAVTECCGFGKVWIFRDSPCCGHEVVPGWRV